LSRHDTLARRGNYSDFLDSKRQQHNDHGFDPQDLPSFLYPFQSDLVSWALRRGRAAIFADCGLGKTPMQLVWADQVARHANGRVLILTPLAVSFQTAREAHKFGIEAIQRRDALRGGDRIVVTNYERLDRFDPHDFVGCVCDESSILKNFSGATRKAITEFMRRMPYRLLCTATAAPNDWMEIGTSSEALGVMENRHMLARFFTHDSGNTSSWRLKGHVRQREFWRWMASWARAVRSPSDLGYQDGDFRLPELVTRTHVVASTEPLGDYLFDMPAIGLSEQRADLRRTLRERCEMASWLITGNGHGASIAWCNLNAEGDLICRLIPGSEQVAGKDSDDRKEEVFSAFVAGDVQVLITKPSIGGFGLNFQHCAHQTFFPWHSYEQYYQCVRRSWRFGQRRPVCVDMVTTHGQESVLRNLQKKAGQAEKMFACLVAAIGSELRESAAERHGEKEEMPRWLS